MARLDFPAAPGTALPVGERVDVPHGDRLQVGWAVDRGLVDPAEGVEVTGPAQARVEARGAGGETAVVLVVAHGRAFARARNERAVAGAFATLRGQDAEWTVDQRADRLRVVVERGEVWLERSIEAPMRLAPGTTVDVLPDGSVRDLAAASQRAAATSPAAWAPPVASAAGDPRAVDRASFLEAELALRAGNRDGARERLEALLRSSDAALAGDAAFLLARSTDAAAERADVLARYLRANPPEPYRAQARAERATALCEAGRVAEARALLDASGDAQPLDVTRGALASARACVARAR
jgi:hypothetical protein